MAESRGEGALAEKIAEISLLLQNYKAELQKPRWSPYSNKPYNKLKNLLKDFFNMPSAESQALDHLLGMACDLKLQDCIDLLVHHGAVHCKWIHWVDFGKTNKDAFISKIGKNLARYIQSADENHDRKVLDFLLDEFKTPSILIFIIKNNKEDFLNKIFTGFSDLDKALLTNDLTAIIYDVIEDPGMQAPLTRLSQTSDDFNELVANQALALACERNLSEIVTVLLNYGARHEAALRYQGRKENNFQTAAHRFYQDNPRTEEAKDDIDKPTDPGAKRV